MLAALLKGDGGLARVRQTLIQAPKHAKRQRVIPASRSHKSHSISGTQRSVPYNPGAGAYTSPSTVHAAFLAAGQRHSPGPLAYVLSTGASCRSAADDQRSRRASPRAASDLPPASVRASISAWQQRGSAEERANAACAASSPTEAVLRQCTVPLLRHQELHVEWRQAAGEQMLSIGVGLCFQHARGRIAQCACDIRAFANPWAALMLATFASVLETITRCCCS